MKPTYETQRRIAEDAENYYCYYWTHRETHVVDVETETLKTIVKDCYRDGAAPYAVRVETLEAELRVAQRRLRDLDFWQERYASYICDVERTQKLSVSVSDRPAPLPVSGPGTLGYQLGKWTWVFGLILFALVFAFVWIAKS